MRPSDVRAGGRAGVDSTEARQRAPQHAGHAGGRALEGAARVLSASPSPDADQQAPPPWGTEGPVQAEVFVVRLRDGRLELTGPWAPDACHIDPHKEDDPMEIVKRLSTNLLGPPLLVHSTSWRRGPGGVFLTFLVVIGEDPAGGP